MNKIYRNGKKINDPIYKILIKNTEILYVPLIFAFAVDRAAYFRLGEGNLDESLLLYAIYFPFGFAIYLFKTVTRLKPLAKIEGNDLTLYLNIFRKYKVDLTEVNKISCQFVSGQNQLIKLYYPAKAPKEITVKQNSCSIDDFRGFINDNHSVNVVYS
ncbi:hypothetical protein [Thalassotalea marina]|uniref:Uncharacterized protein n=1 Tax=Thalassotalea marina TaxID=1673741 RepID=A0A919BKJ3_9GAMM|nr:hypothetical protein [Thalassotalea marina]GHF96958.1 hypothetical protein GCM10017161_26290 [Thalassotalea marina]